MYPCKPQFFYIKVGCKGCNFHGHVSVMIILDFVNKLEHTTETHQTLSVNINAKDIIRLSKTDIITGWANES